MVVWVSWAAIFAYPWAAIPGLAAGAVFVTGDPSAVGGIRVDATRCFVCVGLLVAALLTYQPGVQFFFVALIAWLLLGPAASQMERRKTLAIAALIFGVSCVCYVLLWWLSMKAYPQLGLSERTSVLALSDLPEKLRWFLLEPLKQSANLFFFGEQGEVALVTAVTSITGVCLLLRRRGLPVVENLALLGALIVLSYLANTVVAENWAAYRTRGALAASVLLIALVAAREVLWRARASRWVWRIILILLVTGQSLYVRGEIARDIIEPQQQELGIVRARLRILAKESVRGVFFQMPDWQENMAPLFRYGEIGSPSSMATWVPQPMVSLLWKEVSGRTFEGEVVLVPRGAPSPYPLPPHWGVIDMPSEYAAIRARNAAHH
jgi:hypothetical protein